MALVELCVTTVRSLHMNPAHRFSQIFANQFANFENTADVATGDIRICIATKNPSAMAKGKRTFLLRHSTNKSVTRITSIVISAE